MKRSSIALSVLAFVFATAPLSAQMKVKEEKPGLLKMATISAETAIATAQAKVPKGKIQAAEIEQEDGKLIYSFDIKTAGKSGIDEVNVDAKTGAVLGVDHESPAAEAKEAKADKAKADSAKAKRKMSKPPVK
jgi:hypothetical protein